MCLESVTDMGRSFSSPQEAPVLPKVWKTQSMRDPSACDSWSLPPVCLTQEALWFSDLSFGADSNDQISWSKPLRPSKQYGVAQHQPKFSCSSCIDSFVSRNSLKSISWIVSRAKKVPTFPLRHMHNPCLRSAVLAWNLQQPSQQCQRTSPRDQRTCQTWVATKPAMLSNGFEEKLLFQ